MTLIQEYTATQSDVEQHIYNLIQQGEVFKAKMDLELINRTNGYEVISKQEFKRWHIHFLKNKSVISFPKNQNQNSFSINQKDNQLKEYQKAYMKMISN